MLPTARLAGSPAAENKKKILTERPDMGLWNAGISPNGKWICLSVESRPRSMSRLVVVGMDGSAWKDISDGTFWDDKPRWSADGRLIYFVSDQGGMINVWAVEFDPVRGVPGKRFQLTKFGGPGERIVDLDGFELGYGGNRLAIGVSNASGGIWMLDGANK